MNKIIEPPSSAQSRIESTAIAGTSKDLAGDAIDPVAAGPGIGESADSQDGKIQWMRCLPFIWIHVACLSVFLVGWNWVVVGVAASLFVVRAFGITGFYHRYFSHRAFKTTRIVQFVGACLGNAAVQRGPIWWASHHRVHHHHSDTGLDAHSPEQHGFWFSHMGWFMTKRNFDTVERDYHGTTITALSSSGQDERRGRYGPFTPGFVEMPHCCEYRCQYEDTADYGIRAAGELEQVILAEGADTVGAVILEPITAGGGIITPPEGYWETIQRICKQYDVLLIIDEVVCGVGRTGKWFAYQHYGVQPDIVTMAKGVASGYAAISCTVTTEAIFEQFKDDPDDRLGYFRDVSTFGGCAAGPAAALENMRIIEDEDLLANVTRMGDYLLSELRGLKERHEIIGDVRGKGLFCGIELVEDRQTKQPLDESLLMKIAADCMANGVIIGRTNRSFREFNNTITLCPALIAGKDDIDAIVAAIDAALTRVCE